MCATFHFISLRYLIFSAIRATLHQQPAMSYCHTCRRNIAFREVYRHAFTDEHWENEEQKKCTESETWCSLCECKVPRSGLGDHVSGKPHQQNLLFSYPTQGSTDSGRSFSDELSEEEEVVVLPVSRILYSQNSIRSCFQDDHETSLEEGIHNIRSGRKYPLEVVRVNGEYVALNNRTLYCYKRGGRRKVEAFLISGRRARGRKAFGRDIKVRGPDQDSDE